MAKIKQRHNASKFVVGDRVRLRKDVLARHAKSIPASTGYSSTEFRWRKTLKEQSGRVGRITRIFASIGAVTVRFRGGPTIGIGDSKLVKVVGKRK